MTDYKLVPIDPTPEMVEAAEDAYMPFGDMELAIRMAMLAAPDVQGEPVGEVRFELGAPSSIFAELYSKSLPVLAPGTKLYTAPQPAEQQPSADDSLTPVPDEVFAAEFAAWWEQHGQFCRAGGGDYERTFAFEAWRHLYPKLMKLQKVAAEQQPALTKYQPCGCVICTCEHETQCQGCGAKHCGTHPVGQIPGPVYQQPAPDVSALVEELVEALEPFINKATGEKAMSKPKNRHRNLRSLMREGSADFDPVPARQPALDVKALVEALTELCDEIDNHDIHSAISKTNILWFKRKARAALAAHRKQQENK